ncbi:TorD/DmsD family molecular chaperone [Neobacillus jeddahensis]|uniref:TorD/DmsD family molecular chaperone n=1 Tax=Neobacillus jeddahensis TaxID=1461580 RepID=UPI000693D3D8|nr:molecular chaperone TorD family protein [Neobacillus jeddahensis]
MTLTKSIHTQLQPFMQSRQNFYKILYSLFLDPTNEEILFEIGTLVNFGELEEFHEGGGILACFFAQLTTENYRLEIEEYHRLFVGPGYLAAPPWESFYRSKDHLLFDDCMLQIRDQYHQFGLKFIKENNEPDDHLLLELEFMIHLSDLCLQPSETDEILELISSQIHLHQEHLSIWIPNFCDRVIDHTKSQLYIGAAMLLKDFINYDLASLLEIREALANV